MLEVDCDLGRAVSVFQCLGDDAGAMSTGHVVHLKCNHGVSPDRGEMCRYHHFGPSNYGKVKWRKSSKKVALKCLTFPLLESS